VLSDVRKNVKKLRSGFVPEHRDLECTHHVSGRLGYVVISWKRDSLGYRRSIVVESARVDQVDQKKARKSFCRSHDGNLGST